MRFENDTPINAIEGLEKKCQDFLNTLTTPGEYAGMYSLEHRDREYVPVSILRDCVKNEFAHIAE